MSKNKEFDKICELYKQEEAFWVMSGRSSKEIQSRREDFFKTYSDVINQFINENIWDIKECSQSQIFNHALKERGYTADQLSLVHDFFGHWDNYNVGGNFGNINNKEEKPKTEEEQRKEKIEQGKEKALNQFHAWLYRNAGKSGYEFLGSKGNHREYLEHNFMTADREVQKLALFYLEKDYRKLNENARNSENIKLEYENYEPDYKIIRRKMFATWMKFWKRTDGSYLYWNKLKDAFEKAKTDVDRQKKLEKAEENQNLPLQNANNQAANNQAANNQAANNQENAVHGQKNMDAFTNAMKDGFDYTFDYSMLNNGVVAGMNLHYGTSTKLPFTNFAFMNRDINIPDADQPFDGKILGYNGATDTLAAAFKMVTTTKGAIDNWNEAKESAGTKSSLGTADDYLNSGTNAMFAGGAYSAFAKGICDIVAAVQKTIEVVKEGVKVTAETAGVVIGKIAGVFNLIGNAIKAAAGVIEGFKFWKGASHAQEAAKNARDMKQEAQNDKRQADNTDKMLLQEEGDAAENIENPDPEAKEKDKEAREAKARKAEEKEAEATKLENRAEFAEKANNRKFWGSAVPKVIAGVLGVAAGVISVFTLGVAPVVGAIIGLTTALVFFLGEKLAGMAPSRNNKRMAVDAELMKNSAEGKEKIEKEFAENRKKAYEEMLNDPNKAGVVDEIKKNMDIVKKTNEKGKESKELGSSWFHRHVGNINRRNIEADNGYMNHDEAFTSIKGKIVEESLNKIYGSKTADGRLKNGMTVAEFNANKEILRSMGVKSKNLETADGNNKEDEMKKAKHVAGLAL